MFKLIARLFCLFCPLLLLYKRICIFWLSFLRCHLRQILPMALSSGFALGLSLLGLSCLRLMGFQTHDVLLATDTEALLIIGDLCVDNMHAEALTGQLWPCIPALLSRATLTNKFDIVLVGLCLHPELFLRRLFFTEFVLKLGLLSQREMTYLYVLLVSSRQIDHMPFVKFFTNQTRTHIWIYIC